MNDPLETTAMLLTIRRAENRRVETFLAAIRATAVPAPVRPLPLRTDRPTDIRDVPGFSPAMNGDERCALMREHHARRTDTASLPRIIATAGSVLVAGVVLAGCGSAPASTTTDATSAPITLELGLPVTPELPPPSPVQTGTDAGLITDPAPGFELPEATSASTTTVAPAPVVTPAPAGVLEVDATAVDAPAPAPVEPSCAPGEQLDPEVGCVAVQLPEEHVGGARCEDPAQVVVAVLEDGTAVCGAP